MSVEVEKDAEITVSRQCFGFRVLTAREAHKRLGLLNRELGISMGLEDIVTRWTDVSGLLKVAEKNGVRIKGLHLPFFAHTRDNLVHSMESLFSRTPRQPVEALLGVGYAILLGGFKDPSWARRYNLLDIPGDIYIVMHPEAALELARLDQLLEYSLLLNLGVENGWGKLDNRPPLSYDPETLREFSEKYDLGVVFDTSAAARSHRDIENPVIWMFKVLGEKVKAIHLSDYTYDGKHKEGLIPGKGEHGGELREIVAEAFRGEIPLVIEIFGGEEGIKDTLSFMFGENIRSKGFSFPGSPTSLRG